MKNNTSSDLQLISPNVASYYVGGLYTQMVLYVQSILADQYIHRREM